MKFLILPALALLWFQAWTQTAVPSSYYTSANSLSGPALKSALNNIIDNHTTFPYTVSSPSVDTWDILKETDRDPNNPDNVILIYSGLSVNAAQEYNNGNGWTREHVWAKSRGNFGTIQGVGTDVHALRPLDAATNSARSNRWFNECTIPYDAYGNYTCGANEWSWEPRDAVKGDVARMIFYMAVRYEGENGEPDLQVIDSIPTFNYTNDPVHAKLCTMMAWHFADPVDAFEQNRNNIIYNNYQGNRNPFIDNPNYAWEIWGDQCSTLPVVLTDFQAYTNRNSIQLNWTVATSENVSHYEIERSFQAIEWDYLGREEAINSTATQLYRFDDFAPLQGSNYYRLKIIDEDGTYTYSPIRRASFNQEIELSIYPNPSFGKFTLKLDNTSDQEIALEVFNALGQNIHNETFTANVPLEKRDLDLTHLSKGQYSIRITSNNISRSRLIFLK